MFKNDDLISHLETKPTIELNSMVYAEINMNDPDNIEKIGNYRNRNGETVFSIYDSADSAAKYTGYTDSDIVVDGGVDDTQTPIAYASGQLKNKLLYSLEDCFKQFRPRSGINKAMYLDGTSLHFVHNMDENMMQRPRYYVGDKNDKFKYWSSFRYEADTVNKKSVERGVSRLAVSGSSENEFYIDDASPFIVYKESVPVNRIIIKTQTHVGTQSIGQIYDKTGIMQIDDPMYDAENDVVNRVMPVKWKVQYLDNTNSWKTAISFTSAFSNGIPIMGRDGYLELEYKNNTWGIGSEVVDSNTSLLTEFTVSAIEETNQQNNYLNIKGLRLVVDTISKKDSTFELIELSPRLAVDFTNIVQSYDITKTASDLGSSGLPVGQLLASTGSVTFADYDRVFSPENTDSIIAKKLQRNIQVKFYEIIKNVPVTEVIDGQNVEVPTNFYVPMKTLYADSFPSTDAKTRSVSINLRDMFSYFESITAPQLFIRDVSLSYAVAMILDAIGFTNYIYKKSPNDNEPIIPDLVIAPNTSVAEVLQDLAVSTQTATFFDEENNLVFMSRSYMLPGDGDRETDSADLILRGSYDAGNPTKLINIKETKDEQDKMFNSGKISYVSRYIQKSTRTFKEQSLSMKDRVWVYQPVILWDAPTESKFNVLENGSSNNSYSLSAVPLNSDLSSVIPTVNDNHVIQNNTLDLGEGISWLGRTDGYLHANGEIIKYDAVEYFVQGQSTKVWINSQEEYAEYFARLPFGGKIYPTGKVRIYVEPYYLADGSTPKPGAVAKHGRGQFNTEIVSHSAGISESHWTRDTENIYGMSVYAKYIFSDPTQSKWTVPVSKSSASGQNLIKINAANKLKIRKKQTITGTGIPSGAKVKSLAASNGFTINKNLTSTKAAGSTFKVNGYEISIASVVQIEKAATGKKIGKKLSNDIAKTSKISGLIRNFLSSTYFLEDQLNESQAPDPATVQSSALVFSGPTVPAGEDPQNFMSYIVKKNLGKPVSQGGGGLEGKPNHVGARMRIVGQYKADSNYQILSGAYAVGSYGEANYETVIKGASGGIGICVDTNTNNGYFFEIAAFSSLNIDQYGADETVANIIFYKTVKNKGNPTENEVAFPVRLWSGMSNILADNGELTGQYRMVGEENPTVYDLAVEYRNITRKNNATGLMESGLEFLLYLNNNLVGKVVDTDPLPIVDSIAMFIRGSSKVMFENFYALSNSQSANYVNPSETPLQGNLTINKEDVIEESYRKYTMPEALSATYFEGISAIAPRKTNIFFDEFGTIMREADYFNIKYDKAYPALTAIIAPTFNRLKGYAISGFVPDAYGAEFLIFNISDKALSFNSNNESYNWLRILGVTFTQESNNTMTMEEYFAENSNLSDGEFFGGSANGNIILNKENYQRIKNSVAKYGKTEFNIEAPYIQTKNLAESLMKWLIKNVTVPRKSVGVDTFATPHLQLGDIVSFYYNDSMSNPIIASSDKKFVVYNISYSKNNSGLSSTIYLSEVIK